MIGASHIPTLKRWQKYVRQEPERRGNPIHLSLTLSSPNCGKTRVRDTKKKWWVGSLRVREQWAPGQRRPLGTCSENVPSPCLWRPPRQQRSVRGTPARKGPKSWGEAKRMARRLRWRLQHCRPAPRGNTLQPTCLCRQPAVFFLSLSRWVEVSGQGRDQWMPVL